MALVDYGSSDSEDETVTAPPKATASSSGLFSSLPQPKNGLSLPPPSRSDAAGPPATSAPPKKKDRGPVKITIGPTASTEIDEEAERARKRARTMLSSGGGLKGLAGMLPAPKASTAPVAPIAAPKDAEDDAERAAMRSMLGETSSATSFVPKATKAKAKAPTTPATDFFSLGSTANTARANGDSLSSVSFSAAPTLAEPEPEPPKPNYYSTLPPPSLSDPYPGFHALPSGDWAADDPQAWDEWVKMNGWDKAPAAAAEGVTDVKGHDAKAGPAAPKQDKPGRIAPEDNREAPNIRKSQNTLAKGRHQLSHMLHSAYENRQELEDRIATAKQNRRSAAQK